MVGMKAEKLNKKLIVLKSSENLATQGLSEVGYYCRKKTYGKSENSFIYIYSKDKDV